MALPTTLPTAAAALFAHPLVQPLVRLLLALLGLVLGVYKMISVYRYEYGYKTRTANAVPSTSKNTNSSSTITTTPATTTTTVTPPRPTTTPMTTAISNNTTTTKRDAALLQAKRKLASLYPSPDPVSASAPAPSALPIPASGLSASPLLSELASETSKHTLPHPINKPRPIPNSYWATLRLLACEYPWAPPGAGHVPICEASGVRKPALAPMSKKCAPNPSLALTSSTYAPKLDALLLAGVRAFVDLTEPGELAPYSSLLAPCCTRLGVDPRTVSYARFAFRDRCVPDEAEMYAVMTYLRGCTQLGKIVAVHCRGGIGRTGMVVGCWLVECGAVHDGQEALEVIEREWRGVEKHVRYPCSPETGAQVEFVGEFCPEGRVCGRACKNERATYPYLGT